MAQSADFLLLSLPVSLGRFKKRYPYNKVRALLGLLVYLSIALVFAHALIGVVSQDPGLNIYRWVGLGFLALAITLIYFKRQRSAWSIFLDLYEGGFVFHHEEGTRVVLWDRIGAISERGRGAGFIVDLLPEPPKAGQDSLGTSGPPERESILVTSKIAGLDELSSAIQEGAAGNTAIRLDHAIRSGESYAFGPIAVSANGLTVIEGQAHRSLAWRDTKRVELFNHTYKSRWSEEIVIVSRKGGSFYDDFWAHLNADDVPQHAILLALCKRFVERASQEA